MVDESVVTLGGKLAVGANVTVGLAVGKGVLAAGVDGPGAGVDGAGAGVLLVVTGALVVDGAEVEAVEYANAFLTDDCTIFPLIPPSKILKERPASVVCAARILIPD